MIKFLIDKLMIFLEKIGRKWMYVDMYGNIFQERYFPFYIETFDDKRLITKLPNIWIHKYPSSSDHPEGLNKHNHPWHVYSWVINGEYEEIFNDLERTRKEGSIKLLKNTDYHTLLKTSPGTITVFAHWFKSKSPMKFIDLNSNREFTHDEYVSKFSINSKQYRLQWLQCTTKNYKKIERRKLAVKKLISNNPLMLSKYDQTF